ncbi:MarR family winged helix-turn-helix transcriptional regulator [Hydrogenophaga sp. BPS33]|uniref:MarR family winged helix-turn-helix transcriptional regulator n=1 Tax=Hydrogenophaga sp. BPS33 TaxID=2651974 RepID=UPI00131FC4DF|nr:MarR family transcriptional regulator [Hydrogenophaga sp. BPS33]QHE87267.1 MarR family transcriptional regulator [Hydrogenophaga sp. BPS33]
MQTNSDVPESDVSRARSRFGLLLGGVYRQWRRQVDLSFKTLGLSDATRMPLLALYAQDGAHMRQKDMAQTLHLDTSSLVRVLSQLRDAGYVDWEPDPADRRAKCIGLTPSGREVASQILARSLEIERLILEGLSAEELAVTRRTLEKIAGRFEALHQHDSHGNCP